MALLFLRSFCRLSEKLYKKPISVPCQTARTNTNVISEHIHVHPGCDLKISKYESISVRIQKNGKDAQRKSVQEELKICRNDRTWFQFRPEPIWYKNRKTQ